MSTVETRSPAYTENLTKISRVRDFIFGEDAIKAHDKPLPMNSDQFYLYPFNSEMEKSDYLFYSMESQFTGVTSAMHNALSGALLRRDPDVVLPDDASWIMDSFGETKQGLLLWLSETLSNQLISSNDWVFIDYPDTSGQVISQATREAEDIRPYPIHIQAEAVLDARTDMVNGVNKLVEFRYLTVRSVIKDASNPFQYTNENYVVRLFLQENIVYRQDYIDGKPQGPEVTFNIGNQGNLDTIPVFSLSGINAPVLPYLNQFANSERALYNKVSRRNHAFFLNNTITPWTSGVDSKDQDQISGFGQFWHLGEADASVGTLQMPQGLMADSKIVIDDDYLRLAGLGARMFADGTSQAETAQALSIKNASSHSVLAHISTNFSSVIENILSFVIYWDTGTYPEEGTISVTFSKDFIPEELNGQDLTALVAARMQGLITDRIFYGALNKGELIPEGYTIDEYQADMGDVLITEPPRDAAGNQSLTEPSTITEEP